jgi:hypothetical protein
MNHRMPLSQMDKPANQTPDCDGICNDDDLGRSSSEARQMTRHVEYRALAAAAGLAAACATSKPAGAPRPATLPPANAQDSEYVTMGVAAASQVKTVVPDRVIGLYETASTASLSYRLVRSVIDAYGFVAIHTRDAQMICAPVPQKRAKLTAIESSPSCAFDLAEVLVQFNSIQIVRDTGYVGGLMAEIPRGTSRVRTTAFCILAARSGTGWDAVKYGTVEVPQDCASDRKH